MTTIRAEQDGRADFDFLMGRWAVRHRRLRERLKGSTDWEEFSGTTVARPVLGGLGNVDENRMERDSGVLEGITMRLFDPLTQQWSIYWADSLHGTLGIPMIGQFKAGQGEFFAQEPCDGKQIFSRFIWSVISASACRWEQAFSADGGKSWETNWIMDFTRQE